MVRVTLHIPPIFLVKFFARLLVFAGIIWLCSKSVIWALVPFALALIPVILFALAVAWPVGLFMACLFSPLIVWKGYEWIWHNWHKIEEQEWTRPTIHPLQACVLSRAPSVEARRC